MARRRVHTRRAAESWPVSPLPVREVLLSVNACRAAVRFWALGCRHPHAGSVAVGRFVVASMFVWVQLLASLWVLARQHRGHSTPAVLASALRLAARFGAMLTGPVVFILSLPVSCDNLMFMDADLVSSCGDATRWGMMIGGVLALVMWVPFVLVERTLHFDGDPNSPVLTACVDGRAPMYAALGSMIAVVLPNVVPGVAVVWAFALCFGAAGFAAYVTQVRAVPSCVCAHALCVCPFVLLGFVAGVFLCSCVCAFVWLCVGVFARLCVCVCACVLVRLCVCACVRTVRVVRRVAGLNHVSRPTRLCRDCRFTSTP